MPVKAGDKLSSHADYSGYIIRITISRIAKDWKQLPLYYFNGNTMKLFRMKPTEA